MSVTDLILPAGTVEFDPFSDVFFNDPFNTYGYQVQPVQKQRQV